MVPMLVLTEDGVRTAVRDFILANFLFTDDPAALDDDESFQQERLIDSMGMIQVIQFLESEYQVRVQDHEMVPEQLDSVNRIVRLICAKRGLA
jgi:acyl carrier protein